MPLSDELHRLLESIAKANGHSHPAEWAEAVKAHFAASAPAADAPAAPEPPAGSQQTEG